MLAIIASLVWLASSAWPALVLALGVIAPRVLERERAKRTAAANRERWHGDPCAFALEALGVTLTDDQAGVLRALASSRAVSWRAAQKTGKTLTIAVAALWWAHTRPAALVVLTSGNAAQVRIVIWRELRRLHRNALPLGGKCNVDPATGLVYPDGRLVVGLTASEPERFAGYSGAELFFCVDEASGFSDELLETVIGNLGGGGAVMLTGNPTRVTGLFARTHREGIDGWSLHHSSARRSPNVLANRIIFPGLATAAHIAFMESTFGPDSAAVAVRVDGEYPSEGSDTVIPFGLLSAAVEEYDAAAPAEGALSIGVDPARYGDDATSIQGVRGYHALVSEQHRKLDLVEVAARARAYVERHRIGEERVTLRVDVGGLGAGVYDHLVRAFEKTGVHVLAINSSSTPRFPDRFKNTRCELWWSCRRWLENGGTLPRDERRDAELLAARYSHDEKLRIKIASKDEMRSRLGGRSPDRADSLALATYGESPVDRPPARKGRSTDWHDPSNEERRMVLWRQRRPELNKSLDGLPEEAMAEDVSRFLDL